MVMHKGLCTKCKSIPGMEEPIVNGVCSEICGDGFNFGINECDDGNLISGDGCSADCVVEEDWRCENGTSESKD